MIFFRNVLMKSCFGPKIGIVFTCLLRIFKVWIWVTSFLFCTFQWESYCFFISFCVILFPFIIISLSFKLTPYLFANFDFGKACWTWLVFPWLFFNSLVFEFTVVWNSEIPIFPFTFVPNVLSFVFKPNYTDLCTFFSTN